MIQPDNSCSEFMGPDGLMVLLKKLSDGELPADDVLEVIKRLYIPGHEHARKHFDRAMQEDIIDGGGMSSGFYNQSTIGIVLVWVEESRQVNAGNI